MERRDVSKRHISEVGDIINKIVGLILLISILLIGSSYSISDKQALSVINSEIREYLKFDYYEEQSSNKKNMNSELLHGNWTDVDGSNGQKYDCLVVYGQPFGDADRYLGYTMRGEEFTNFLHPHDQWNGSITLEMRNWIKSPWYDSRTCDKANEKYFNASKSYIQSRYLPNIIGGLELYYGDAINKKTGEYKNIPWQQYMHVLQPPTDYSWGMGRMWHETSDGKLYYITIPLVPNSHLGSKLMTHYVDENGIVLAKPLEEQIAYSGASSKDLVKHPRTFTDYKLKKWHTSATDEVDSPVQSTGIKAPAAFKIKSSQKTLHLTFTYESTKPMVTITVSHVRADGSKLKKEEVYNKAAPDLGKSIETSIYINPIAGYGLDHYDIKRTPTGGDTLGIKPVNQRVHVSYTDSDEQIRVICTHVEKVDLILKKIEYRTVPEERAVLIEVTIENTSVHSKRGVALHVEIPGSGKKWVDSVDLKPLTEQVFRYAWTTPTGTVNRLITAHINPGEVIAETTYTNNKKSLSVVVTNRLFPKVYPEVAPMTAAQIPVAPKHPTNDRVEWTELRYSHTNHWTDSDGVSHSEDIYVEKSFYARLTATLVPTSTAMKSGYGFGLKVKTHLESNYDKPNLLIGPQSVDMVVPEYFYSEAYRVMLKSQQSLGSFDNTYELRPNPITPLNAKRWYIPVWFPNAMAYTGVVDVYDCYTPGGTLRISKPVSIQVNGHMYEDDWTGR